MSRVNAILKTLLVNVVAPLVIYYIASRYTSQVEALVLSGIPPAVNAIITMVCQRQLDILASLTVVSIALSAVIATLTEDPKLLLVKDSSFTIIIGATFLGSTIYAKEDLIWSYNRQLRGPDAKDQLDAKYAKPDVRGRSQLVCRVWGSALLLEAAVRVVLVYSISVDTMVYVSPILMIVTFATLGFWTKWYVSKVREENAAAATETTKLV
ncbi:unnamed protein product [Aphanomyces euteiches]|uniref:Uncharacterized protein n=1 Tax=Aphanomyces euteiches TaxID=100861 RepID=A0A6G0XMC6_9STRA|nr:hypothetical protein Ae201684_003251 [Aphanomyces euteiches]KAH9098687.1 hypothetical protein Ae201684P_017898 [Aphanomyces euteiches]KAH9131603.1 hypothetical protein AeRB84_021765 [Aphanomyces euteiches]